jgi:hypothetical protein
VPYVAHRYRTTPAARVWIVFHSRDTRIYSSYNRDVLSCSQTHQNTSIVFCIRGRSPETDSAAHAGEPKRKHVQRRHGLTTNAVPTLCGTCLRNGYRIHIVRVIRQVLMRAMRARENVKSAVTAAAYTALQYALPRVCELDCYLLVARWPLS